MKLVYRHFKSFDTTWKKSTLLSLQRFAVSQFKDRPYLIDPFFSSKQLIKAQSPLVKQLADLLHLSDSSKAFTISSSQLISAQNMVQKLLLGNQYKEQLYDVLGGCLALQEKYEDAVREYNKAWKIVKNSPEYCIKISICLLEEGNTYDAIKLLEKQTETSPKNAGVYHHLAIANIVIGNYREVIFNFQKAFQINPNIARQFIDKGKQLMTEEKYNEALPFLMKWFIYKKDDEEALNELKRCFIAYEKIEEGQEFYSILREISEYQIAAQHSLALLYFETGRIQQAKEHLLSVLKQKSNNYQLNLYLGTAYIQQSNYQSAITCFQKCQTISPNHSIVLSSLALAHMKLNQIEVARNFYEQSIKANEKDSMGWYGLGVICIQQREIETGIRYLRKAIDLDQYNYPALEKLANVVHLLGDEKEAEQLMKRAEKARPKQ